MGIVADLIYIVLAALLGGFFAQLLRQPLIFGYILAGILVGPHTGGPTIERIHDIEMLAEIGVALLLFTLGLEFSFGELKRLARIAYVCAPLQILLSSLAGYLICVGMGFSWKDAIWIGGAISLSSTMVVIKTLSAQNAQDSQASRIMLTILIAQDLAVIPLMLILPQVTSDVPNFYLIGAAVAKSVGFLTGMYFVGTKVIPRLFQFIARWGSRELFFLSTLGIALGIGFFTYQLGLSFALGAFVAGMLLSDSDFSHQALSDVASLRDLFGLLFFVSVGMLLDPRFFIQEIGTVLTLAAAVILCKAAIIGALVASLGFRGVVPWTVGLGLSQVGEFAFLVANSGNRSGNMTATSYSLMISVTVVSMILTPGLLWLAPRLFLLLGKKGSGAPSRIIDENLERLHDHIVVIGGGTVGQYVARVLSALELPFIVVETDHKIVMQLRDKGVSAVFGDASQRLILEAAGVGKARLVLVALREDRALAGLIHTIKGLNGIAPVVVRVEEIATMEEIAGLGIHEMVQPQLEVGLEMVRQALLALGSEDTKTFALLSQLRAERYNPANRGAPLLSSELRHIRATRQLEFIWFDVGEECPLCGSALHELRLPDKYGLTVIGVIRDETFSSNPGPNFSVQPGDTLGMMGTAMQLNSFQHAMVV